MTKPNPNRHAYVGRSCYIQGDPKTPYQVRLISRKGIAHLVGTRTGEKLTKRFKELRFLYGR